MDEKRCLELLEKHDGDIKKVFYDYDIPKNSKKEIKENEPKNDFKTQMMIIKTNKMDEKICLNLLRKHNGDIKKVFEEYEGLYSNQLLICKSYGMDETKSLKLLQKHSGNIQKVLYDYYEQEKPKEIKPHISKKESKKRV